MVMFLVRHPMMFIFLNTRNKLFLGWAYRGLTGGFLLHQNFSVAISVSPHVCFFDFCVSKIMHL